ncbi:MAG: hypothetical protein AVDCRST_MAG77-3198 [uncultured Chloroflexi bacterium]|uniref:Uncharacterized protein n=1 Tax=uncultured Chloroflexota bacterium TaxID=166587 RepID=A0A6J4J7X5_9CHLR|nr:MAG: hypothetical protein AVDCRST_MAG77-3198 [uncultured Chloroflexota bacterium]
MYNAPVSAETAETLAGPAHVPQVYARAARSGRPQASRGQPGLGASFWSAPLLLAGFCIALYTQLAVMRGLGAESSFLGFALGAGVFTAGVALSRRSGLLTWRDAPLAGAAAATTERASALASSLGIDARLAGAALALSVLTFLFSGGNAFTLLNVTTWLASVVLGLAACWHPRPQPAALRRALSPAAWLHRRQALSPTGSTTTSTTTGTTAGGLTLRLSWTALALAAILAVGFGLLFYRIDSVPREMTSDHAEKLLDVADVLEGQHRIFFPRNTGREAFQFYWIALMTPLTGVSYLTMKLGTALLAFGTLPFTYVLARTLFGTHFALLATAVLAGMRWLWQVGRVGLRFPFPPLFGAAVFCFLIRALRDRRRNDFLLCGLMLGIAQHTYTALRIAPFGVIACIAIAAAADYWKTRSLAALRPLAVNTVLLFAISVLVFMPLARYGYDDPRMFLFRGVTRMASDSADKPPPNIPEVFIGNVKNAYLMFNWKGDQVWVNTIPGEPMLDPIGGALFVLGCAYALYRLIRHRELPYAYLMVLLFTGLLPSIMSLAFPVENPSTVRMGMAIPITAILVALPLFLLARRLRVWMGGRPGAITAGVGLALVLAAMLRVNFDQYFRIYPAQHARASQHSWHVARAINGFIAMGGRRQDAHILPGANWVDWRLVAIQAGDVRWQALLQNIDEARGHDGAAGPRLYVLHPADTASQEALRRWYPGAIQQVHALEEAGNNPWFVTVLVPAGARAVS